MKKITKHAKNFFFNIKHCFSKENTNVEMQELMTKMKRKRRTWPEAGGNEIWAGVYSRSLKTGNTLISFIILVD